MSEPIRLSKRVIELTGCSRREAELYIEGGWVRVDGVVVEQPQFKIVDQHVEVDPNATLEPLEPATLLLHQPVAVQSGPWRTSVVPTIALENHSPDDLSGIQPLHRHLTRLSAPMPLDHGASGLVVLTQDWRVVRRLTEDSARIEQEYQVEVRGTIATDGLARLCHGQSYQSRVLPPCKASWQSENRLRFAIKHVHAGQLRHMCAQVGLEVTAIKRLRIGRIPLSRMAPGQWRFLPTGERF